MVLLVFKDSKSPPFNPLCIRSQFNRMTNNDVLIDDVRILRVLFADVFMVVQVDETVPPPKKHYK